MSYRTLEYLEKIAIGTASDLASGKLKVVKKKSLTDKLLSTALGLGLVKNQIFSKAKAQVIKSTNGLYPAPLKVIDTSRRARSGLY